MSLCTAARVSDMGARRGCLPAVIDAWPPRAARRPRPGVAIRRDRIVGGAPRSDGGSAYLFDIEGNQIAKLTASARTPPLSPEAFDTLLATKKFTNGAGCDLVIGLYKKTVESVLGATSLVTWSAVGTSLGSSAAFAAALGVYACKSKGDDEWELH